MAGPVIETERLILRPTAAEDFDGWAELMGDVESSRYIGGPVPRAAAWRGLATMAGSWSLKGFGMFSMIERERPLDRTHRPVAAGAMARHRSRLGPPQIRLGSRLRL